jgi:hypothetical protein
MPPPSRDRYEGDGEYEPRPKRSGGNGTVIMVIAIVGGLVLVPLVAVLLVVLGCCGFFGLGVHNAQQAAVQQAKEMERQAKEKEKALLTREQFEAKWIGKDKNEVLAGLGKPGNTGRAGKTKNEVPAERGKPSSTGIVGGEEYWDYYSHTRDAISGQVDFMTRLWFDDAGKVSRVTH